MNRALERHLFESAIQLPAEERTAFVREAASHDPRLYEAVLSLLQLHAEPAGRGGTLAVRDVLIEAVAEDLPDRIGPFKIHGLLGRGGMGVVYRAARDSGSQFALKLLRSGSVSRELLARFRREADVLARLEHPGAARFLEAGILESELGARPYIAMELIEGVSLREWAMVERTVGARIEMLIQVTDAVAAAHEKGIVHRDLKPENIVVRPGGAPCVLDFGVARLTDSDLRATTLMTTVGAIVGTIRYMSPEQADPAKGAITPRADIYALGLIAWELLAGNMPYEVPQDSVHRALVAVLMAEPGTLDPLHDPRRGALERLLKRALAKEPAERHLDASELSADLRRVARGQQPARSTHLRTKPSVLVLGASVLALALFWSTCQTARDSLPPDRLLAEASAHVDSATRLIQVQERSVDGMRESLRHSRLAESLLRAAPPQAWTPDLLLASMLQQSDAHGVLAEFTRDPSHHDSTVAICDRIDGLAIPFGSPASLPDSLTDLVARVREYRRHIPGWRQAGALFELSSFREPGRNLDRALVASDTALQVLLRHSGAGPDPVECSHPADPWLYFLLMHQRGALLVRAYETWEDSAALGEGLRLLRALAESPARSADRRALAALMHTLGRGWLQMAAGGRDLAALDSSLTRLRFALRMREGFTGSASHVESRISLAHALRLEARLRPVMTRANLVEAESLLVRGLTAGEIHEPGLDAQLWLARADLSADQASVLRDTSRVTAGLMAVARAEQLARAPLAPVERARLCLLRARLHGARWSLLHDERSAAVATQQALECADLLGQERFYVWRILCERGRRVMTDAPAQPPGLDYPFPAFSPGTQWWSRPRYPLGGAAVVLGGSWVPPHAGPMARGYHSAASSRLSHARA